MSDYQYEEEGYNYDEQQPVEEENIETKIELEYFEIEDHVRGNRIAQAISQFQKLYQQCEEHNVKSFKVKILNQLLAIYTKQKKIDDLISTLHRISELNKSEKYTENAIKTIISIVRVVSNQKFEKELLRFIDQMEFQVRLKSYLYLMQKSIEQRKSNEIEFYYKIVDQIISSTANITASILLQFYSLEIKCSKIIKIEDISDKIRDMEFKLTKLQSQAYMSEDHISILKLAIAEQMFESGNYEGSATYIYDSFVEKAKYGNSSQLKEILKTNALICLLIENPELRRKEKYNALFQDAAIPFKNQDEIHSLISSFDAYEKQDMEKFKKDLQKVKFNPQNPEYHNIYERIIFKMKKQKLVGILKTYRTIRLDFIARRLQITEKDAQKMIFQLIVDEKINAKINDTIKNTKHVQILAEKNQFLQIQAQNLRQLGRRFI